LRKVVDHLQRTIHYRFPPQQIISLAPAITNTMYHLNINKEIVGRTRFCIHPKDKVDQALNIGGTKDIKLNRIHRLNPDLVIAEKEENTKEIVEQLEQYYPVYVFEVQSIADALRMINDLGNIIHRQKEAHQLRHRINELFKELPKIQQKRVAYVIWKRPFMVVGKQTYINSLLNEMGFINPFTTFDSRYPEVTIEDLKRAQLDYIFLATEPYPFRDEDISSMKEMLPNVKPLIVDGEMFWYGFTMTQAVSYFKDLFRDQSLK